MIQGMAIFEAVLPFLQTDVFNMQFSPKKRPLKINMMRGVSVPFMLYDSNGFPQIALNLVSI